MSLKRNGLGYYDPTAYEALKKIASEERRERRKSDAEKTKGGDADGGTSTQAGSDKRTGGESRETTAAEYTQTNSEQDGMPGGTAER